MVTDPETIRPNCPAFTVAQGNLAPGLLPLLNMSQKSNQYLGLLSKPRGLRRLGGISPVSTWP